MKLIKHYNFKEMTSLPSDFNVAVGDKWHNDELQQYHNHKENIFFDHGLVIQATLEDGIIKSGRMNTRDKFFFKYGKIEMIAKLPVGRGAWPAFWLMPQTSVYGHWPKSGEIDIVEFSGNHPHEITYALHSEACNHKLKNEYVKRIEAKNISDDFHKFGLIWEENKITYLLDDEEVVSFVKGQDGRDTSHKGWPFTEPFYIILNLALGGWMGGEVDYNSFPQQFIIKEIKIYQ